VGEFPDDVRCLRLPWSDELEAERSRDHHSEQRQAMASHVKSPPFARRAAKRADGQFMHGGKATRLLTN
jgi:hypothetical protein